MNVLNSYVGFLAHWNLQPRLKTPLHHAEIIWILGRLQKFVYSVVDRSLFRFFGVVEQWGTLGKTSLHSQCVFRDSVH